MHICDKAVCTGCGACMNICPKNCIEIKADQDGFNVPVIDKKKCIQCGLCISHCPQNASINLTRHREPAVYAAYSKNTAQMSASTSGGIFPLLAKQILKEGGAVYGTRFTSEFEAEFERIDSIKDLTNLQGSKYVQSTVGVMYRNAKEDLAQGKKVLFSGTPCQIGGLYSFLGKDYDNLYTIDIVCRGVPSGKVLKGYISYCEKKEKSELDYLNFRHKEKKWQPMSFGTRMHLRFKNGNKYSKKPSKDLYYKTFLANIAMMESCYQCHFNGFPRVADITLGDFLGLGSLKKSELYNPNGISQVLLNSDKGSRLYAKCTKEILDEKRSLDECCYFNLNLWLASKRNPNREKFFYELDQSGAETAIKKYVCGAKKEIIQTIKDIMIKVFGEKRILLLMHKKRMLEKAYPKTWNDNGYMSSDDSP